MFLVQPLTLGCIKKYEKVAFDHWMNRLIQLKSRALDVAEKADKALVRYDKCSCTKNVT